MTVSGPFCPLDGFRTAISCREWGAHTGEVSSEDDGELFDPTMTGQR